MFARILIIATVLALTPAGAANPTHAEATGMAAKIARIQEIGAHPRPRGAEPIRTVFTDSEMNAYLEFDGPDFLPLGVARPRLSTGDAGRVTARAIVDLDAVRLSRQRSFFDPFRFLTGSLEVTATGSVVASNGRGVGRFVSATVAGVPIPKSVAEELLRFYTQTRERPDGFGFDTPFELPAGIRSVTIQGGRVTVVQ